MEQSVDWQPAFFSFKSMVYVGRVAGMRLAYKATLPASLCLRRPAQGNPAMSLETVEKLIKDHKVEFVDLRFADMRGVQHHVTFPKSIVDATLFEDGKMFDGSSISGWRGIHQSDMVLLPDPATAFLDPFTADPTLVLTCDILDPTTMQAYSRDPRGIAKRAEAHLKSSGIAEQAFFGPEPEFFIFDSVRYGNDMGHTFFHIDS
jgi:glutamine synthetase